MGIIRKMVEEERRVCRMIAHSRLHAGEGADSVVDVLKAWLITSGWSPAWAARHARELVAGMEKEISEGPKVRAVKSSLYEAWRLPGFDAWQEGEISATEAKAVGAIIKIKGVAREFRLKYESRWGDDRFPWKLRENQPVGTLGAEDNFIEVNEFSTMTAARAEARMLARGAAGEPSS